MIISIEEFRNIVQEKEKQLSKLIAEYIKAQRAEEEFENRLKVAKNKVLNANNFLSEDKTSHGRLYPAKRILDESEVWLLSESDFKKYQSLCSIELLSQKLILKDGTYSEKPTPNEYRLMKELKLLNYFISLFPDTMLEEKELMKQSLKNYTKRQKLLGILLEFIKIQ